jgi:hypothetical protein
VIELESHEIEWSPFSLSGLFLCLYAAVCPDGTVLRHLSVPFADIPDEAYFSLLARCHRKGNTRLCDTK